jgi:hypothetical protein
MAGSAIDTPYDPSTESTNEEQVAASRWELLRRNKEFQTIARKWVDSRQFREAHALTPEYCDADWPRCALDWMLTSKQRLELANYQVAKLRWKRHPHPNFGPVIYREKSLATLSAENATEMVDLQMMQAPYEPVTVTSTWARSPEPFQRQFRYAVLSPGVGFECLNDYVEKVANHIRWIARKLAAGDPLHEMERIGEALCELGNELYDWSALSRLYRISRSSYSSKVFNRFLNQITEDFSTPPLEIFDGRKYERHRSYLGTAQDWRWFLEAERRGLDIRKSADLAELSVLYCEDLRQRAMRGKAPRRAKAHGHSGSKFPGKVIKGRRRVVKQHVLAIEKWIRAAHPLPKLERRATPS